MDVVETVQDEELLPGFRQCAPDEVFCKPTIGVETDLTEANR